MLSRVLKAVFSFKLMVPGFDAVTGPVHLTLRRGLAVALAILLLLGTAGCGESVDHLVAQAAAMRCRTLGRDSDRSSHRLEPFQWIKSTLR